MDISDHTQRFGTMAELEALVRQQQTMIAELKQEQKESMKELRAAIMTNSCK